VDRGEARVAYAHIAVPTERCRAKEGARRHAGAAEIVETEAPLGSGAAGRPVDKLDILSGEDNAGVWAFDVWEY